MNNTLRNFEGTDSQYYEKVIHRHFKSGSCEAAESQQTLTIISQNQRSYSHSHLGKTVHFISISNYHVLLVRANLPLKYHEAYLIP